MSRNRSSLHKRTYLRRRVKILLSGGGPGVGSVCINDEQGYTFPEKARVYPVLEKLPFPIMDYIKPSVTLVSSILHEPEVHSLCVVETLL